MKILVFIASLLGAIASHADQIPTPKPVRTAIVKSTVYQKVIKEMPNGAKGYTRETRCEFSEAGNVYDLRGDEFKDKYYPPELSSIGTCKVNVNGQERDIKVSAQIQIYTDRNGGSFKRALVRVDPSVADKMWWGEALTRTVSEPSLIVMVLDPAQFDSKTWEGALDIEVEFIDAI